MKNKPSKNFTTPSSGKTSQPLVLYGRHAVLSALGNPQRRISKIFCLKENLPEITSLTNIPPQVVDKKEFEKILPPDAVHQGFALYCSRLPDYSLEEIIDLADKSEKCHILILDQVTDPQNIGTIIRSAVAFNTLALIMQDKNSPLESGAMAKAAAGMIEHLPVARVTNLSRAIEKLKQAGFWVIGMDGTAQTTFDKINKSGKTAVIMGSEGKGMRRLIEENCDILAKLPMSSLAESLNVSAAAAIALYEINK